MKPILVLSFILITFSCDEHTSNEVYSEIIEPSQSLTDHHIHSSEKKMEYLTEKLQLSDAQKLQLEPLFTSFHEQRKSLKNQNLSKEEKKKAFKTFRQSHEEKLKSILTEEQFTQFKAMKKKRFKKHGKAFKHMLVKMTDALELTEDQVLRIKEIVKEERARAKTHKETLTTKEERHAYKKAHMQSIKERVFTVLSAEQRDKAAIFSEETA